MLMKYFYLQDAWPVFYLESGSEIEHSARAQRKLITFLFDS